MGKGGTGGKHDVKTSEILWRRRGGVGENSANMGSRKRILPLGKPDKTSHIYYSNGGKDRQNGEGQAGKQEKGLGNNQKCFGVGGDQKEKTTNVRGG